MSKTKSNREHILLPVKFQKLGCGCKNVPDKIFLKIGFTGTSNIHRKKHYQKAGDDLTGGKKRPTLQAEHVFITENFLNEKWIPMVVSIG